MNRIPIPQRIALVILTLCLGCSSSDDRVAEIAMQATREQAEQNHRMAQLQREVAAGSKQLVEAEAAARQQHMALEAKREAERAKIAADRKELHMEQRELEAKRQRDPIVASAILQIGTLLACLLPLALCGFLLRPSNQAQDDAMVAEILISELAAEEPRFLPRSTQVPLLSADEHAAP